MIDNRNIWKKINDTENKANTPKSSSATLYVAWTGDDTDGLTWRTAFHHLEDAVDVASLNRSTLINIGLGIFDIHDVQYLLIDKNLHIKGRGGGKTVLTNTLGTAGSQHSILKFSRRVIVEGITFDRLNDGTAGIWITGPQTHQSVIKDCEFLYDNTSSNRSYPIFMQDTEKCLVKDCRIWGETGAIRGIYIGGVIKDCRFENIIIKNCYTAILITGVDCTHNEFENITVEKCNIGFWLSSGNGNSFTNCKIHNCTKGIYVKAPTLNTSISNTVISGCDVNIDDASNSTSLDNIMSKFANAIYPESVNGITLPNSTIPETYGENTPIIPAETIDKPFRILAYTAAPSDDKKFIIRLSADSGVTYFLHMMDRRDGNSGELARVLVLNNEIFPKGTEISGSIMGEVGDETLEIWLYIQEV